MAVLPQPRRRRRSRLLLLLLALLAIGAVLLVGSGRLSAEVGPASWALDPAFAPPTADTTELHILVWERACSSGSPATGRMSAPVIEYTPETVTITIGVRPLQVAPGTGLTCPMPPGTPAIVRLPEPLGERALLDGGQVPPVPPSPANG